MASIEAGSRGAVQEAVMVVDVACPISRQLQGAPVPSHCTRYMLPFAGQTSVTPHGMPAPEAGIALIWQAAAPASEGGGAPASAGGGGIVLPPSVGGGGVVVVVDPSPLGGAPPELASVGPVVVPPLPASAPPLDPVGDPAVGGSSPRGKQQVAV